MFDEIEKFLKQAAESAQQDQQRRAAEQRRRQQQQQQRQPQRAAPPPPRTLVQESMVVEAQLAEVTPLGDLEKDFRSTDEISAHTRQLGSEVGLADQNLQAHLSQTFDHQVGTLKKGRGVTDVGPARAAGDSMEATDSIFRMIASRDGIRDAIILGEVLRRPEERW